MSTRLRNIIIYSIGFVMAVILTYFLYHLGINVGSFIRNYF